MKTKPYYVLIKWNKSHPQNKLKPSHEIWQDYNDSYAYGSPLYEVLDYFDSFASARKQKYIEKRAEKIN